MVVQVAVEAVVLVEEVVAVARLLVLALVALNQVVAQVVQTLHARYGRAILVNVVIQIRM